MSSRPQSRGASSMQRPGQVPSTPGQTAGYGVSLNTQVNVADRPVTQQGMMGMRLGTGGPGRQVQDSSYFIGKLHQKVTEISSEVENIKAEIERNNKDKSQYTQLERKYEGLIKEVREYEGQLADYNLAMDNLRSATDPADIQDVCEQLKQRNKKEAEEVDQIFIVRQEKEGQVHQLEEEIQSIQRKQEQLINELAPMKLEQYKTLAYENMQLEQELGPKIQEIDMMTQYIRQKEETLTADTHRDQYARLEAQCDRLRQERDAAQEDARTLNMDPEEARAIMLEKVKSGKAKMAKVEGQVREGQEEIDRLSKAIQDLQLDLKERQSGGDSSGSQKYEMLFQRDKEMTAFIDSFEEKRLRELKQQTEIQNTIVALLEHTSEGLEREGNMPNKSKLLEMQDDLSFKEKQLETSQMTKERLEKELAKRQSELEKINTLDEKIRLELGSLSEKLETMDSDLIAFKNVDQLRSMAEDAKQQLQRLKQQYIRRRDAIKQQVLCLSQEYEQKQHRLADNDTAKTLDSLEQKLRHYEQNIFHMKQFIDTKNREVNYGSIKDDCMRLVEEANAKLIQIHTSY